MKQFPHPTPEMLEHWSSYPLIFVHEKTNEIICEKCAHEMAKNPDPLEDEDNNIFKHYVYDIYYEGANIFCDRCNKEIESAYGDPDEEENDIGLGSFQDECDKVPIGE